VRIIAGEYKGRRLKMVEDNSIRPATDRVKGSIFNMLQNRLSLVDAQVLDLFAGSGSLAFEAFSRGAAHAVLVDSGRSAIEIIESNAEMLGCDDLCMVLHTDAMQYLEHCREKFDLIFADPPYKFEETADIPGLVFERKLLKDGGILIIEHSKFTDFQESPMYKLSVCKEFGATKVSFFIYPISDDKL
jgi:16S rRNA (guanine966-N2)-methyltransferase